MPLFEQLKEKYAGHDVAVLNLYVREPHPDETIFTAYHEHKTYEQKMQYAQELVQQKDMSIDVLVDGIDEEVHHELGDLPNMVYVVGKDGHVHYKATWADADRIDKALAELVAADGADVAPTLSTQKAPWRINEIRPGGWKRFLPIPW